MARSLEGIWRHAAGRIRVPYEEYKLRREQGLLWCSGKNHPTDPVLKNWTTEKNFYPSTMTYCRVCQLAQVKYRIQWRKLVSQRSESTHADTEKG